MTCLSIAVWSAAFSVCYLVMNTQCLVHLFHVMMYLGGQYLLSFLITTMQLNKWMSCRQVSECVQFIILRSDYGLVCDIWLKMFDSVIYIYFVLFQMVKTAIATYFNVLLSIMLCFYSDHCLVNTTVILYILMLVLLPVELQSIRNS